MPSGVSRQRNAAACPRALSPDRSGARAARLRADAAYRRDRRGGTARDRLALWRRIGSSVGGLQRRRPRALPPEESRDVPRRRAGRGRHSGGRVHRPLRGQRDRKSTRLNSSHLVISYAVFCLKKKKKTKTVFTLQKKKTTKHN